MSKCIRIGTENNRKDQLQQEFITKVVLGIEFSLLNDLLFSYKSAQVLLQ